MGEFRNSAEIDPTIYIVRNYHKIDVFKSGKI